MSETLSDRRALYEGLLVLPRAEMGTLAVTGSERVRWLNGLVTCELGKLSAGDGAYGLAVGKTGKILEELFIVLGEERLLVAARRAGIEALREHLERHLIMEDAEIVDASEELAWILALGPQADAFLGKVREAGAEAARVDVTGRNDGVALAVPRGREDALRALALELPFASAATEEGWEALRIELGVPRFGVDFDEQNLPQEASLEKLAVSFSKGCYLGQEAVFMLENRGHAKKHLMRLAVEDGADVTAGAEIALADGTVVGSVTSSTAKAPGALALGMVKHKHAAPDVVVRVGGRPAKILGRAGVAS